MMRFTAVAATTAFWLLASSSDAFLSPKNNSPLRFTIIRQHQHQSSSSYRKQSVTDDDTNDGMNYDDNGASSNNNNNNNKNKRKPRFAQDAHARSNKPTAAARPRPMTAPLRDFAATDTWNEYSAPRVTTTASAAASSPPRVFTTNNNSNDDGEERTNDNNSFMWKTGKSIDDLENSMTTRFGTDSQQWAADPSDYELEDGTSDAAASDFGRKHNNNKGNSKTGVTKILRAGKPVWDPWQREDKKESNKSILKQQEKQDRLESTSSMFDAKSDEDYILNRARRNQPKQQQQQNQDDIAAAAVDKPRTRRPKWADLVDEFDDDNIVDVSDTQDFYDEDDEGFEAGGGRGRGRNNDVGKLISPKPVGGQGTFEKRPTKTKTVDTPAHDENNNNSPGYFFNANVVKKEEAVAEEAAASPTKRRQRATPLLCDDGKPVYLSTDQAEQNFKAALAQSGGASDDNDELDDEPEMPTTAWDELGITSERLLTNLESMGCPTPLSVQEKSCPSILTGNDVLIGTYTGSGKTLAFLVPLVQQLLFDERDDDDDEKDDDGETNNNNSGRGLEILIVAPGRELASQIASVARDLLQGTDLTVVLAIGGTTFSRNLETIRKKKPTIIVGTPGRIAELVVGQPGDKSGRMKIASLQSIVLDEFDALLEYKPHRDPTAAIMAALQRRHRENLQSILCSATATDMVGSAKLNSYLRPGYTTAMADMDDKLITAGDDKNAVTRVSRTVMHGVVHVQRQQLALDTIRKILHTEPVPQQVLIFADNARRVDLVVEKLAQMDIIAAALHGGAKSEKMDRAEVSKALREGYVGIVVATELAARGLDAPLLTHVINLDLPTDASHYAHRAGRCGRGGRPGVVVNITTGPKERNVPRKFAQKLGVDMFAVEPRAGKMVVLDPTSLVLDINVGDKKNFNVKRK